MSERIIFAPGVDRVEFLKNLAIHGINTFNTRIMNVNELADYYLMKSAVTFTEKFVDNREETIMIAKAVEGEDYFGKVTYKDICNIARAIRNIRSMVVAENEDAEIKGILDKGIFKEKNAALFSVYQKYIKSLRDEDLLDRIDIVKRALNINNKLEDVECFILEGIQLSPLEEKMLSVAFTEYKEILYKDLYQYEEKDISINSIKNCYGAANEVETILSDIYAKHKLDECTVAVADPGSYGQLFYDYAILYDIPITIGCGIPVINSNPAKLLINYTEWMTSKHFHGSALLEMIGKSYFNRNTFKNNICKKANVDCDYKEWNTILGEVKKLRLTNDSKVNEKRISDYLEALKKEGQDECSEENAKLIAILKAIAEELSISIEEFIHTYAYLRRGSKKCSEQLVMALDMAANNAIYEQLYIIQNSSIQQNIEDIIKNVLATNVKAVTSSEGKLFVVDIGKATSSIRKNLYVAGLTANKYPGSPRENYLLLDKDIELFGNNVKYLTSEGKVEEKRQKFFRMVKHASGLSCNINLSYSGLNISELKKENASSVLHDVFEKSQKNSESEKNITEFDNFVHKVDYFEPGISLTREVGKAYNRGENNEIENVRLPEKVKMNIDLLDREYSPSAISKFFESPRSFMMKYILGIEEKEELKPTETFNAKDKGILAHKLMELLGEKEIGEDEFIKLSSDGFDIYMLKNPCVYTEQEKIEKEKFVIMMRNAYNMEAKPKRELLLKEEKISAKHEESGIKISGLPDRVEKLENGNYLVVDFKTGYKVRHEENDINTCIQVVIYSYILEKNGYNVEGGEFRYLSADQIIKCRYDDEIKEKLSEKLMIFKEHLMNWDFPEKLE